jgi:hypothetical protein
MRYVVIAKLPIEQQEPFKKWLIGQTCPAMDCEGENKFNCAYVWDYNDWLNAWKMGKIAPIND